VPCEDIAATGGAERYHADKKYEEAVATAVAACAAETNDDTPSNGAALLDDLREAVAVLEDVEWRSQRLYGDAHPETTENQLFLRDAREQLARAEGARARRELRRHQFCPVQPPRAAGNAHKLDPQWRHTRREELEQKLREHEAQIARLTAQIAAMKQEAPPPEEAGDAGG
jgi:hypothetical protein